MTKTLNLSAKTPTNLVTMLIEVEINDFHNANMFCIKVSSPELFFQYRGESSGCSYADTMLSGYLETLKKDNGLEYGFKKDKEEDTWDEDYFSISVDVSTKEEVEYTVANLVKGFKSYYKAKRHDFLMKQQWLSKWEFVEE